MTKPLHILLISMLSMLLAAPAIAGIGKGNHVNIVSFQDDDEVPGAPNYPATFNGSFGQLISAMEGQADPLLMVHTPHIHPGDVITIQVNALGEGETELEDDGMDCSLSYNNNDAGELFLGGMCTILNTTANGTQKHKVIIPPHVVPVTGVKNAAWVLVFHDKETNTAFYANIEE